MKKANITSVVIALFVAVPVLLTAKDNSATSKQSLCFIENRGQVTDQFSKARADIQFALPAGNVTVFVGDGQLHYQFAKLEKVGGSSNIDGHIMDDPAKGELSIYRMDVELVGANRSAQPIATEKQTYREHYYLPGCGIAGVHAGAFKKITYKDIYPGIDWVIYVKDNKLEHEFVVGPKGNTADIQLRYSGHTSLQKDANGNLVAKTPMGIVTERAPVCYTPQGKEIPSSYSVNGNLVSYDVSGYKGQMTIDPQLLWGTYYGPDSSTSPLYGVACDDSAKVYSAGLTWSGATGSIATTGAYQVTFGGLTDAYLIKFDSSGNRLWATYYGGTDGDWATAVACDRHRNVYVGGVTSSTGGIATPGCQQPTYGGGPRDGFLAKFNSEGILQWGTYIGGSGANTPSSVSCDSNWHVYIAGESNDPNNISTPGSYQAVKAGGWDAFLVQYDSAGVRQWGTYYGGSGSEFGGVHTNDNQFIYLAALTPSTSGIASVSAYQPTFSGGGSDVFVAKFGQDGARFWGSYYGGDGSDNMGGITCDKDGAIYVLGTTSSTTNIASPGCYQAAKAGGAEDAFLMKLEPELGYRVWGTYFGGAGEEVAGLSRIGTDDSNHVYILGNTTSTTGIATTDARQTAYGGGDNDGFFAKFSSAGALEWSTYYGGSATDEVRACAWDGKAVYICGITNSTGNIATAGSFLSVGGGGASYFQGFLSKFGYPDTSATDTTAYVGTIDQHISLAMNPNPNNGLFELTGHFGDGGIAQVVITDISGKVVLKENVAAPGGALNKQLKIQVAPGVYFLRVACGTGMRTLKFIKE
jgi:hypothetical protein